ncbi:hypothetical protein HDV05_000301 [Chytridiales sp. JEL 0842]|nr:hypothetical protein HDV05_000301 [Chytridiales sp. JEL 0842]
MSSNTGPTTEVTPANAIPQTSDELSAFVENILKQLQGKFDEMSGQILGKMDEMGTRIDDLEKSIGDLVAQSNDTAGSNDDVSDAAAANGGGIMSAGSNKTS